MGRQRALTAVPFAEREFDRTQDLPRFLDLVSDARASGHPHAFLHAGGLQWLLRRLGRESFRVSLLTDGDLLAGFAIDDAGYVIAQAAGRSVDQHLRLLAASEARIRARGGVEIEVSVWDDDSELRAALASSGFEASGTYGHELVTPAADRELALPEGFSMGWLEPTLDDAYVELHRDAWSARGPSPYNSAAHAAVVAMPDFDRHLVPIAIAPDGTLAAYCIGWFDPRTRTVEIEPLGTRPSFRRRGLARAIVDEVVRRSAERGATSVLVWGVSTNAPAVALYESSGFRSQRILREFRRKLEPG